MNNEPRNIVLVHGAFADASSWLEVIVLLHNRGFHVTGVQIPLQSLEAGVAATLRVLDAQYGPTVLVGHSYGGTVVSEAGTHSKVAVLVYVAALAPEPGEEFGELSARFTSTPGMADLRVVGGLVQFDEAGFIFNVAHDVAPDRARMAAAVQNPIAPDLLSQRTTQAAWKEKPTYYAISTQDRVISPDLQRFLAKRMGARAIELNSSHASLISHAAEVAELIASAALS